MSVEQGELFGLIGPDGAGKTTLFRIMATLLLPDKGNVIVNGHDVRGDFRQIRNELGYMPGRFSLYMDLTVMENLNFYATIFGTTIKENYHLIEDIYQHLEPFGKRMAKDLSGGMKQKLALCCALIHKPVILFLDEPTTGVDPVSREEFWQTLSRLQKEGITIVVSTPYMDEAQLCDRLALIDKGRFMMIDTPTNISAKFPYELWHAKSDDKYKLLKDLREYEEINKCWVFGEYHHFTFNRQSSLEDLDQLNSYLINRGHKSVVIERTDATIEDTFMYLSGNL